MRMGLETEYGIVGGWSKEKASGFNWVAACQPHLPATREGVFLLNGGCFYVDLGSHPEYATPESTSPRETVIHALAGHEIVKEFAATLGLEVFHGNVDYLSGNSWGAHENYELSTPFDQTGMASFLPHLATRIVYCGAGGLDPRCRGARFVISPRAFITEGDVRFQGVFCKSLVFNKPDNYGIGHRLHIICGDSNCSHLAAFLKVGATALIAELLDAHVPVGPGPFAGPAVLALHAVSGDPALQTRVAMADRRQMTALAVQRAYLEDCRRHLDRLPAWAPRVLELWDETLSGLEAQDKDTLASLDWGLFRLVWRSLLEAAGLDEDAASATPADPNNSPIAELRARCAEAYLRYHQVGVSSLFTRLEFEGFAGHRIPKISSAAIHAACREAPPGRARTRAALVSRLEGQFAKHLIGWDRVIDLADKKCAAIPDTVDTPLAWTAVISPDGSQERQLQETSAALRKNLLATAITANSTAIQLRKSGQLPEAERLMRLAIKIEAVLREPNHPKVPHRHNNLAAILMVAGKTDEALSANAHAWTLKAGAHDLTSGRILTVRIALAMLSGMSFGQYVGQFKTLLNQLELPCLGDIDPVWDPSDGVRYLESKVPADHAALVGDLARTLNDRKLLPELELYADWANQSPVPLTDPWPERSEETARPRGRGKHGAR